MWFCKGKIIKIQATTQNSVVALSYKLNPAQNTTIIAENAKNSLNSVPHIIKIKIQISEKFSLIVTYNLGSFLKCEAYCFRHYSKLLLSK